MLDPDSDARRPTPSSPLGHALLAPLSPAPSRLRTPNTSGVAFTFPDQPNYSPLPPAPPLAYYSLAPSIQAIPGRACEPPPPTPPVPFHIHKLLPHRPRAPAPTSAVLQFLLCNYSNLVRYNPSRIILPLEGEPGGNRHLRRLPRARGPAASVIRNVSRRCYKAFLYCSAHCMKLLPPSISLSPLLAFLGICNTTSK